MGLIAGIEPWSEQHIGRYADSMSKPLLAAWLSVCLALAGGCAGKPQPESPETKAELQASAARMQADLEHLAGPGIGERNAFKPGTLETSAAWIEASLKAQGYEVTRGEYTIDELHPGQTFTNLWAEIRGTAKPDEIVVIGAHYDSVRGSPGANDNGSGVVAVLELARRLKDKRFERTVRLVFWTNEEPPFFQTPTMGSRVEALRSKKRNEKITAVVSVETVGYYSSEKGSQKYPSPLFRLFHPGTGDFVAVVSDFGSQGLGKRVARGLQRADAGLKVERGAGHARWPGIGWSDHWAYWQEGYQAVMITDTAPFRYPHYHLATDTPEKIDYATVARLVRGLAGVAEDLGSGR